MNIDSELVSEYRRHRARGCIARHALMYARRHKMPFHWREGGDGLPHATFEHGNFTVSVTCVIDECPDLSYLGKLYTDREQMPGDVRVLSYDRDSDGPMFFRSATSEEEHYRGFRDYLKLGRAQAWERARQCVRKDAQAYMNYGITWSMLVLDVRVYFEGIELGREVVSGVSIGENFWSDDTEQGWLAKDAEELVSEAIDEAHDRIRRICALSVVATTS